MDCVSWFTFLSQTCDFGCGFLLFGCFKQMFNLISLILFINLGIKIFQFGFHFQGKYGNLKKDVPFLLETAKKTKKSNGGHYDEYDGSDDGEITNVDDVFDVTVLRKMAKSAYTELEKERTAAATAADEAMSMILRVQNEKSLIEMEYNHHRRLVEQKQNHDQEVIQSLRWIVMKHELERSYLEDQLRVYKRRFKIKSKGDDLFISDENDDDRTSIFNSSIGDGSPDDGLISSLDFDISP